MSKLLFILVGLTIPFLGTCLGSMMVFFMKKELHKKTEQILLGFASGVMIASSIWSLVIPSIDLSNAMGKFAFIPTTIGFFLGIIFLILIDFLLPESREENTNKFKLLFASISIHNLPEGMAVGIAIAGALTNNNDMTIVGALSLAIGIGIQNFPEGAIVSMPLKSGGMSKKKSFLLGVFSGVIEPLSAIITILLMNVFSAILPYLLSFAAGTMIYVVINELVPVSQSNNHSYVGTIGFTIGFLLMMILNIIL